MWPTPTPDSAAKQKAGLARQALRYVLLARLKSNPSPFLPVS